MVSKSEGAGIGERGVASINTGTQSPNHHMTHDLSPLRFLPTETFDFKVTLETLPRPFERLPD